MRRPPLPLEGTCRCGDVVVRLTAPPLLTAACHCTGCQRMSSSAFSLTAMVPPDGFEVVSGSTVVGGAHSSELEHHGCARCLTWIYTKVSGAPFVNVRPTLFNNTEWFAPFMETMTSEQLPWVKPMSEHRFERFPPMESLGRLLAEYAAAVDDAPE